MPDGPTPVSRLDLSSEEETQLMDLTSEQKQRLILDSLEEGRQQTEDDFDKIHLHACTLKLHAALWELWEQDLLRIFVSDDGAICYRQAPGTPREPSVHDTRSGE